MGGVIKFKGERVMVRGVGSEKGMMLERNVERGTRERKVVRERARDSRNYAGIAGSSPTEKEQKFVFIVSYNLLYL